MRVPMLFLFGVVVWGTYVLGRRLYSPRVGAWAALLLSFFPPFFLKSIEFRTDNFWTALWVVALLVLTSRLRGKLLLTGLLVGLAFCVSLKTSLLMITLGTAGLVTYLFAMTRRNVVAILLPIALGALLPPLLLGWWFHAHGAWPQLVYCVFRFNELVMKTRSPSSSGRRGSSTSRPRCSCCGVPGSAAPDATAMPWRSGVTSSPSPAAPSSSRSFRSGS
jgi:4-amino-4-deoxy-L-arabinose transferase-like glycosyltransferase